MNTGKMIEIFHDLKQKTFEETNMYFLEHIIKARSDLHLDGSMRDSDEEINVYLAGLLSSFISSSAFTGQKSYVSIFDHDIRMWLDVHPGIRNEYVVYRENADFSLIALGIFHKHYHKGSYHKTVMQEYNNQGRIALYYSFAASALSHLQGSSALLVNVLDALSEHMNDVLRIMRLTAWKYFDIMDIISDGSMYHMERELAEEGKKKIYNQKVDEFLKMYTEYKNKPSAELIALIRIITEELHEMNPSFEYRG